MPALLLILTVCISTPAAAAKLSEQRYAHFGTCPLSSGAILDDCILGYRTYGELNAERSNAVLVPSWFTGSSGDWGTFVGPGRMLDLPELYFVFVDALANGVSSSPSQRHRPFPQVSIMDMVQTEHRLLTEVLGISHLSGMLSVSMGAMQALQWAVTYPDFVDRVVSIAGTPRALPTDMLPWRREVEPRSLQEWVPRSHRLDTDDRRMQLRAMIAHDVAPGRSLEEIAALIQARVYFIVPSRDNLLNPATALTLAGYLDAPVVLTHTWCGHLGPMLCSRGETGRALRDFLR